MSLNIKNTYLERLTDKFYSKINITPVKDPTLVIFNENLAEEIGFDEKEIELMKKEGNRIFSGNKLMENSIPIAQAYAGHQFGYFTMLGDGRAVLLGEQMTSQGKLWDIQLKGSGITPYSRRGDGKAALAPMLREYIISEAMNYLGIPTTRSLAVVRYDNFSEIVEVKIIDNEENSFLGDNFYGEENRKLTKEDIKNLIYQK